jgi:phosphatidylserine/phosphatidylglycerophosphate/cardiolipin synthase-like enzyme
VQKFRKKSLPFFLALLVSGFVWLAFANKEEELPDAAHPLLFYSTHSRNDLLQLFASSIERAEKSLHVTMYALTDPYLLALLSKKNNEGIKTTIFYDPTATSPFPGKINDTAHPVRLSNALMHRKILVEDEKRVFLGSANMTTTSLKMHANLVAGIFHPELARFIINKGESPFVFSLEQMKGEFWLLPSDAGLERILALIQGAKKQILVAMFTLTHPELIEALISAHKRGVDVRVAVDHYTAEGASASALEKLRSQGVSLYLSKGLELFHHKWALIDKTTLILGSANWTKAAFTRNQDCFMILHSLPSKQRKQLKNIWKIVELESNKF